ncbi:MAG: diaminopimelate epimerase [Elusimicrobia bacterium]|nr:diaminopimelate epimerase [Elusimicrobiota bacterium]
MTKSFPFTKLSGAGNDFILLPLSLPPGRASSLAVRLCDRRNAIGADGLLLVNRTPQKGIFRMQYYNSDGSRAFCGNGSRCAALWIYKKGWAGKKLELLSDAGGIPAQILGTQLARIRMPSPSRAKLGIRLRIENKNIAAHFIHTGVPHAVVPVKNLKKCPVEILGRKIRHHTAFGPSGTNVDFVRFNHKTINLRTYERGVEAETLACGTGVTATALVAHLLYRQKPPISVRTQSGDILKVSFSTEHGSLPKEVWLEGPAKVTFEGRILL